MSSPPRIEEIQGLPALVVLEGGWRPEYADLIREQGLTALSVRVADSDVSFLEGLPHLRGLILNGAHVSDISTVEALTALEMLCLNVTSRRRLTLNFSSFRRLNDLAIEWNDGFESVFECRGLTRLHVVRQPDPDLRRFAALTSLRRLELADGRRLTSTKHVSSLQSLTFLGLYYQRALTSLAEVDELPRLEALNIDTCKALATVEQLAGARALKSLHIANCGDIQSLAPLRSLA